MLIMISGPYRSGSDDPNVWKDNLRKLNECAYEVFKKGHVPVIGVNAALPIIEASGMEKYEEIMMPVSLGLAEKCDAVFRTSEPSKGADEEVNIFAKKKLPVYRSIEEIPFAE